MDIVVRREISADEELRDAWNRLVLRMERPEVFYTYEWAFAVARAYKDSRQPLLILGYKNGALAGVVALYLDNEKNEAGFLASTTADYCDFICADPDRTEFVCAAMSEFGRLKFQNLVLTNLPDASLEIVVREQKKQGYYVFSRPAYECAQVVLSKPEEKTRIKSLLERKSSMRRITTKLAKAGPVELIHLQRREPVNAALPDFFRRHVARFLATGRISNHAWPERREFLDDLATLLSQAGWMKFSCLSVGGRQIAWNYGFEFAGSWFWYQPTFDLNYQEYFPGLSLLIKMITEACDSDDIDHIDLGLGAEGYKERVSTQTRQTVYVAASVSIFTHTRKLLRYHAAAWVQSIPWLEKWVRQMLKRAAAVLEKIKSEGVTSGVRWVYGRARRFLAWSEEVVFFQWNPQTSIDSADERNIELRSIDLDVLARATMKYVHEPETIAYLFRAAERLAFPGSRGFALMSGDDPVHLCWVADFQGFHMAELEWRLSAPSPNAVMIFDCWTPLSERGHGHYSR